jgi:hypothetical protein
MCRRAYCEQCQKLTFTGCGQHLDVVFRGVPESARCSCHLDKLDKQPAPALLAALPASAAAA